MESKEPKKKKEKSYWQDNSECAMIETRRGVIRRLFTDKSNLPLLVEFARACKVDLALVKVVRAEVWPLKLLVQHINNIDFDQSNVEYETIERYKIVKEEPVMLNDVEAKTPPAVRDEILADIKKMFLAGEVVSLARLAELYPKVNRSTLRHYMSRVKTALFFDGYEIEEVGRGKYATHESLDSAIDRIGRIAAKIKSLETGVTLDKTLD